ncbi:1-deoxy-D-xylulose-5-phosphate synthase [Bifidobacterium sp. UTCIF-3]|nr:MULTISPECIES: 1-deoxy-D-xylulose-5-phosphate synthase [unclassified Bifidobacterium]TPF77644.1 1-deoxy-D-xylulose-5-phosphate synthase [Bifidobacterium sp. UTCIF-1]TPF79942.1 1-deoxy-D-xylulose-5-phosphate synthase [Bifidobacterium sp. UTCIF-24]TPF81802.1 1-deoxy-D-xylulose-5-phosphate synthase [Bifidobacterium sp. UTCIF-3]TPF83691.1 1-deoxy-D-xylulose-5-phosphate synthase [Bifidobacterium sp. UTCIF-36]TPF88676.1 1-deoxy-D-xylulose-5-phosphate synthase [Bifidobacterium sp. UTBIF-56]
MGEVRGNESDSVITDGVSSERPIVPRSATTAATATAAQGAAPATTDAPLLRGITGPADVKALPAGQLKELCREIRATLLSYGHHHGGHIGSNLGMVEATVALHRVFDSPRDRIVFDVSHQSYVHKMLTGRAAAYLDPERFGDVTGFTNPEESEHDQFVLGHTGTSISLACGIAKTRDTENAAAENAATGASSTIGNVVAVIGDGSLSSGVAFEGLNNAAEQGGNLIIVFNDNEMSIAGDFGGMYGPLARLRASGGTAQPNLFEAFGLDYRYVEAGNDVDALVAAFEEVKDIDHPVVVHIHTLKGAGYAGYDGCPECNGQASDTTQQGMDTGDMSHGTTRPGDLAEGIASTDNVLHTEPWHSDHCNLSDHEPHEGQCEASHWQKPDSALGNPDDPRKYYGKMAMAALEPRFNYEPGLVVISPATPGSNGITHDFRERAGMHYVDTGITESHAVAFAAGIARAGGTPVVATTASFFQRAYDQFFQEMSLNRSRVTVLDFLGGLSGSDNTHSGTYDLTMFANIPGVTMLVPTSGREFLHDLAWSTMPVGKPGAPEGAVVIRVPGEAILAADRDSSLLPLTGGAAAGSLTGSLNTAEETPNAGGSDAERIAATVRDLQSAPLPQSQADMLRWRITHRGVRVAIVGLGNAYPLAERAAAELATRHGIGATVIDPRQCTSLDTDVLESLRSGHQLVVTLEDGQLEGGWGEKITAYYANHWIRPASEAQGTGLAASAPAFGDTSHDTHAAPANPRVLNFGAAKEFTDRVPLAELNDRYGLTVKQVVDSIIRCF